MFTKNLFIVGAWVISKNKLLKFCFKYNIKYGKWSQIHDLNIETNASACTVYEGKIVVSGDWKNKYLKSVEHMISMKINGFIYLI